MLVLLAFVKKTIRNIIAAALFAFYVFSNPANALTEAVFLFVLLFAFYVLLKFYSLSSKVLTKKAKISELEEGMIPAETIYMEKGLVKKQKRLEIKTIINYIKEYKIGKLKKELQPENVIVSSKMARGLTVDEIKKLKDLAAEGKLEQELIIKESAPMVPAVLIGFVLLSVIGDLLWNVLL